MLGSAVNDDVEVIVLAPSNAVNVSAAAGDAVTMIKQPLKLPVASEVHGGPWGVNVTADGVVAANTIGWPGAKPVPLAASVWGSVPLVGANDHDGSTVNDAEAKFSEASVAVTVRTPVVPVSIVNAQLVKLPVALVKHESKP
jgi:hypothetical protein